MFYLDRQCRFIIMDSESYLTGENVDYSFTIDLGMSSIEHDERDVLLSIDNNDILLSQYKYPRWFMKKFQTILSHTFETKRSWDFEISSKKKRVILFYQKLKRFIGENKWTTINQNFVIL